MKKNLQSIFIALTFATSLLAQSEGVGPAFTKASACDTLKNYTGIDYTLYLISEIDNLNTGYLSGTNSYMDLAKAEKYTATSVGKQLTGVRVLFAVAKSGGTGNMVNVNVWNASGDAGAPGTLITSKPVEIASIKEHEFIFVPFNNPVTVTGNFYVGITIPLGSKDTVALATCKSGDGLDNTGWEQSSDSSWHTYASANMDLQADNIIFPVFCSGGSSVKNIASITGLTIYPNPAIGSVNVAISMQKMDNIQINVYNLLGQLVTSTVKNNCVGDIFPIDLHGASPGLYYVTVIADKQLITRQISLSN